MVPYDRAWPHRFAQERAALQGALGRAVTGGIHHVGSTSVPGLDAKPIIDILVGVESLVGSRACFAALTELGYVYAPYRLDEMHWFCKPSPIRRTHHLHLVPTGSQRYREELVFRDLLRADSGVAREYVALKRRLARQFEHDREAYAEAKSGFIRIALDRRAAG
ncbi:MAG: GrpB family protein [Actinobacteria bacterium]|nr:GrpB family protein [Actinomycetota bacterium]